jgi:hypothetical protein
MHRQPTGQIGVWGAGQGKGKGDQRARQERVIRGGAGAMRAAGGGLWAGCDADERTPRWAGRRCTAGTCGTAPRPRAATRTNRAARGCERLALRPAFGPNTPGPATRPEQKMTGGWAGRPRPAKRGGADCEARRERSPRGGEAGAERRPGGGGGGATGQTPGARRAACGGGVTAWCQWWGAAGSPPPTGPRRRSQPRPG